MLWILLQTSLDERHIDRHGGSRGTTRVRSRHLGIRHRAASLEQSKRQLRQAIIAALSRTFPTSLERVAHVGFVGTHLGSSAILIFASCVSN